MKVLSVAAEDMELEDKPGTSLTARKTKSYGSMADHNREITEDTDCDDTDDREQRNGRCRGSVDKWEFVKPNGGWGWLVVLGVAVSNMTTQSIISVFGLLFMRRLPELGIDTSGVSLMVSVQITILNLSGLVTGPILKRFSPRQLASTGAALVIAGLFLTGYANSLITFILTYSTLTGLGIGFLYPSTFVAINSYFTTWRSRAVGLSVAGTGVGQMLLPLLVRYLLDEYGFQGTVLIMSGMAANAFVGACLYQPVEWHMKRRRVSEDEEKLREHQSEKDTGKCSLGVVPPVASVSLAPCTNKQSSNKGSNLLWRIFKTMDWDLLKDPLFLILIICLGAVYSANIIFQMLLPFFLESVGYTRANIAVVMSVMSGADIIGRLILPSITDIFQLRTKTVFFLGAGLSAVSRSGLVWYNTESGLLYPTLAIAVTVGIVRAAIICNFNLCVSDQTTPEKLPSALGLHMVFKGVSIFMFAPLIGFIRDTTGSYSLCMHIVSVLFLVLPFLLWFVEFVTLRRWSR